MEKLFIINRKGQKIAVVVENTENVNTRQGLAFVMHGLGGFKESPQTRVAADALLKNGYVVASFDTTNTFGESDGRYEDATTTNYYEDLEDVINWTKSQLWYQEPFVLVGFSLGGLCVGLYSEKYSEKVRALAPISTVVSGGLRMDNPYQKDHNAEWKTSGWDQESSVSKPGVVRCLPWSHMEEGLKYDLLPQAKCLTMPVLLVVGENDQITPLEHQRIFYNDLPGPKELHIIKDAGHTFRNAEHLKELSKILSEWIKSIN